MLGALLPLVGVVADAIYLTTTKVFLRRFGKFTGREFGWFLFAGIVVVLLVVVPFTGQWPTVSEFEGALGWLLVTVILACIHNLLFFWGMEHESVSEIEPFLLFAPLGGILITSIFFPSERFTQVYMAIAVASLVLLWSHYQRHRIALSRGILAIIAYIIVSGFELITLKHLLMVYSPLTLYLFRCVLILVALTFIVRPRVQLLKVHHLPYLGLLSALVVCSVWATYSAYQIRGVSETLFVFTLSPILVYWLSAVFLKEKWHVRTILASIVIIGLVVWVTLLK
jgi:drug/metabolite transporter (DMT)-like permease